MRASSATDPYPGADAPGPSPRRAVEGATLVIIAATIIAVVASSWPIFATWLDDTRPEPARPGIARALRGRGFAVAPPRHKADKPVFSPRMDPLPTPHLPGLNPHRFPIPIPEPGGVDDSIAGATAKPLTIVQLLDRADPQGQPVVSVNPNETLIVVREMTPWVLLAVKRNGKVEFGWTTRNQVAITSD
jgi:hypothetical protein